MSKPDILVVGSINVDLLLFQPRLAYRGETLLATEMREEFGGKGANQAVQCARLGQHVTFLGAVGKDERGRGSRTNLEAQGIECHLAEVDAPTGLGVVNVLANGEVHATILRGANAEVTPEWVRQNESLFERAGIVILQNEIPAESNAEAIRCASAAGARVIYNAAPARAVDLETTRACDYFVVNEEEARFFLGEELAEPTDMREAAVLLRNYCPRVILTLGAAGSLISTQSGVHEVPVVPVRAVDTTGAGDAYVGAFASSLLDGESEGRAAGIAAKVAAMATTGVGAQTSMPSIEDLRHDSVRAEAHDSGDASQC
ncbi:MAG: ribokinase [Propionicimonas sp.]